MYLQRLDKTLTELSSRVDQVDTHFLGGMGTLVRPLGIQRTRYGKTMFAQGSIGADSGILCSLYQTQSKHSISCNRIEGFLCI